MYEIWAKRRPVQGKGSPFEYITSFYNFDKRFYLTDQLDRNIYQECLVVNNNVCVFYREFEKPLVLKKEIKNVYRTNDS